MLEMFFECDVYAVFYDITPETNITEEIKIEDLKNRLYFETAVVLDGVLRLDLDEDDFKFYKVGDIVDDVETGYYNLTTDISAKFLIIKSWSKKPFKMSEVLNKTQLISVIDSNDYSHVMSLSNSIDDIELINLDEIDDLKLQSINYALLF